MTTKEYISELETDVKKCEIRELLEDDPQEQRIIRKQKNHRSKLLNKLRKRWNGGIEYGTKFE